MTTAKPTSDYNRNKSYLFESHIQILGVRFLKNERKGFEAEVQNAMNILLDETVAQDSEAAVTENSQPPSSSLCELPGVTLRIPSSPTEAVELIFRETDLPKLEQLSKSIREKQSELFLENGSTALQDYVLKLFTEPITIPASQLFLYRGQLNTSTERCLALTTNFSPLISCDSSLNNSNSSNAIHRYQQCFFLYAESPAQVTDIVEIFRKMFGKHQTSLRQGSPVSSNTTKAIEYIVLLSAQVEIQEEVSEGKWHTCPIDKGSFKLRTHLDKKICVNLQQDVSHFNYPIIKVEKCFGMLLSPGRNIASSNMVAIGLNSMTVSSMPGYAQPLPQWHIVASWVPAELNFEYLNTETPRDTRVYFTIAVDLVIENIDEPVRFIFEAKAKIVTPNSVASATEKFWQNFGSKSTKQMPEEFKITVRQKAPHSPEVILHANAVKYEVVSCYSSTQIAHQKQRLSLQLNHGKSAESNNQNMSEVKSLDTINSPSEELENDDDEPLASGTGSVSQECSKNVLDSWKDVMDKWRLNLDVRPKQLSRLVRHGVPEALRPEIWQLLSGSNQEEEILMKKYRTFVTKESSFETVIQRDISRTFPAHERFREPGGQGQESLFRICKAYSNFDEEIGYCQGLSFLVAALLLHMPEEQAFCVLVRIMYNYGLRNLYRCGLEELHCKFYQLERLLDDYMPELYGHFLDLNIETHMYASQWFLTLFTTKFPLNAVFLIIDLFLLDNMDTLLQIALALLKMSKNSLLVLDFEGVMKYFRVTLPKHYRSDENARELIRTAVKINVKKAKKYEKDYRLWLEENRRNLNPIEHLEKENIRLMTTAIRLEQENDDLTQEMLTTCKSKIKLQRELESVEEKAEAFKTLLHNTRTQLVEAEEVKARLTEEVTNLKEMYRKEIDKSESENEKNRRIIDDYKQICKNHQIKLEAEQEKSAIERQRISEQVKSCESCSKLFAELNNKEDFASMFSIDSTSSGVSENGEIEKFKRVLADIENELIQTKMSLAESENRNGILTGQLRTANSELNLLRAQMEEAAHQKSNTWFNKTLSSFRDAAKVKASSSISSGISVAASGNNNNAVNSTNPETASLHEGSKADESNAHNRRYSSRDIFNNQH